ncbi:MULTISPECIES: ABC1 kinase family protein, partial [Alphaproteobacteria]|uniref:ABC1 kinase family protein n=1 Tax=Alphaproteobacteria TaxID=28211 RepID=UPI0024E14AA2
MYSPMGAFDDMRRVAELSAILIRHGLGELVGRIGLEKTMRSAGYVAASPGSGVSNGSTLPGRLRQALEEMGPTFVKLGQILSTRVDLLPPTYIAELCKLRSSVPTIPFPELVDEVEAELGHPLAADFSEIDPIALAGGSIAQVHRARLHSGGEVILKIRRPGIGAIIETDLRLLMRLANVAVAESDELRRFRPREIVTEFARSIRRELDLANECHNAERIAENFRDMSYIHVPRVHWEWTSERMNVQDMASGLSGTDLDAVRAAGLDLRIIAARGTEAVLKMIFEDRFFHADPHPGNVFYRA